MDTSDARRPSPAAPILMIAGGALIVIGSALDWYALRVTLPPTGLTRSVTVAGLRTNPGKLLLVAGIVIVALGAIGLSTSTASTKRMTSIVAALGALFGGAIAIYDIVTPRRQVIDAAAKEFGGPAGGAAIRGVMEGLFDRGILKIDVQLGLWMVLVGAALALIGSLLAAATARPPQTSAPALPPAASISPNPAEPAPPRSEEHVPPITKTQPPDPAAGPVSEDVGRPSDD
jgi:hypothetical protein